MSPHPVFDSRLLGLVRHRVDRALTLGILVLLVVSRVVTFPASIWDQDEAYFAAAVVDFDPTSNHPHPPWFPLWVALGKVLCSVTGDPGRALQLVSAAFSVWAVFPLTALWSTLLRRDLAALAAVAYCLLPGVWMIGGRAYTEPTATALLALAAAAWCSRDHRRSTVIGSIAAGACLLVRPHFAAAVVPLLGLALWRRRHRPRALELLGPAAVMLALGAAWVSVVAGGPGPLAAAVRAHGAIHFSALASFQPTFAGLGLCRALLTPALAVAWLVLAAIGAAVVVRADRAAAVPVVVMVVALGATTLAASNPEHLRYWVPLLAFTVGLVVAATAHILGRWAPVLVVALVAIGSVPVLSASGAYRGEVSPPVAATRAAFDRARESGGVVVVDRTLDAFVSLERDLRPFAGTVVRDFQIVLGQTVPPPSFATVYLWDRRNPDLLEQAAEVTTFSSANALLRRLGQDRFLDLGVAVGAALSDRPRVR